MLLFCFVNVFVPQVQVRSAEASSVEVLPSDSSGGPEREEEESTSTHGLPERNSFSRYRSMIGVRLIEITSSQVSPVRLAQGELFAISSSFSERVLPLRC
jgi:hypothetical protein